MSATSRAITSVGSAWYSNPYETRDTGAITRAAYEEATRIFFEDLNQDECNRIWLKDKCSMKDVLEAVEKAQVYYETKHNSKARDWLKAFSSRVDYYGKVLDVLVQQHPEYISLAWGAMKFLFVAVIEHEEKTKQMSKALTEIGSILPVTILPLGLYPTPQMMETVAHLYAKIMKFLVKAIKWYKSSPVKHAFGAVLQPWALSYKDAKEEIWELSRQIDKMANMAAQAELRGVHEVVLRAENRAIRAEEQARTQMELLRELPATLLAAQASQIQKLIQLALENKSLQQVVISSQTEFFLESKRNQIISTCFLELPTSGRSLGYCISVRDRQRARPKLRLPEVSALAKWASDPSLTTLFLQSSSAEVEKDFLVDLVSLIKASGVPVIWALRYSGYWKTRITPIDILRMLVVQALEINPQALSGPSPITLPSLREAAHDIDWLRILNHALEGMSQVYVVIDAEIMGMATEHDRRETTRWIELFSRHITSTRVKLFISSRSIDESYVSTQWSSGSWNKLRTDYADTRWTAQLRRQNQRARRKRRAKRYC
ncbi:hypothetical protein BP6252_07326 [Coleophoma cylindrospora]|uniref:DUF7708 domain-containing protein n=1 Tax=Coleophoma cylindrospora TaxID=1849047 RepID=A0A3D8RH95_9HELO|nr:hypothetical protein BP6252_07326 [Coleophoma cylindrospora]